MAARILERGGHTLVHNRAGANMAGGVATALLARPRDTGLFEVDEFWLPQVLRQVRPRALLLGNLFRDQLDRYGELETIAERWADALRATPVEQLVLNADDPVVADLGRDREALYFGVEDQGMAMAQMQHAADAKHCRRCGAAYVYDAIFMGHLGHYHCPNCDARRPQPAGDRAPHHARRHAQRALRAAHARGRRRRRPAAARPLQRLQRARGRRAGAGARRAAGGRRGRAAGGLPRLRPRRDASGSAAATSRSCS